MPAHADGSISKTSTQRIHKSNNEGIRAFTYDELVSVTNNCKGWLDELTYAPIEPEPGVGLAMYVRTRHIGTSMLDLKSEEFNHPNLVKLLGYYLNEHELSCVYELNPSLDKLLFGDPGITSLSWATRLKIAKGAANGLSFLHKKGHPAYNQFKTTCIMVDADYNARLRDFEVETPFLALDSYSFEMDAHYSAPEWFRYQADIILEGVDIGHQGKHGFGVESDIYSFGVVLLEMLTGLKVFDRNRPQGKQNLVKWANPYLAHEVNLGMVLDPQLQNDNDLPKGAFMLAQLVSSCLQPIKDERPVLENILQVLCRCYQ